MIQKSLLRLMLHIYIPGIIPHGGRVISPLEASSVRWNCCVILCNLNCRLSWWNRRGSYDTYIENLLIGSGKRCNTRSNVFSFAPFSLLRWRWGQNRLRVFDGLSGEDSDPREGFGPGFSCQTHVNLLPQLPCVDHEARKMCGLDVHSGCLWFQMSLKNTMCVKSKTVCKIKLTEKPQQNITLNLLPGRGTLNAIFVPIKL